MKDINNTTTGNLHEEYKELIPPLLSWYDKNARPLPWRKDVDPYRIWISEIMLQQTRVEAVIPYFHRFMEALPSIQQLAEVPEEALLKLWEGLGYYSRARNLKKAAEIILRQHGGRFPDNYAAILALPGIGPYTAGAIASIAFNQPTPAVDGNVLRVMARLLDDHRDSGALEFRNDIAALLAAIYPKTRCGCFTQSLMELGALVCVPGMAPKCEVCPVSFICKAYHQSTQGQLPVKALKKARRLEERTVFLLTAGDTIAIRKRTEKGVLTGLWEFPGAKGFLSDTEIQEWLAEHSLTPVSIENAAEKTHIFTHIQWNMRSFRVVCREINGAFTWVSRKTLEEKTALPTAFRKFLPF